MSYSIEVAKTESKESHATQVDKQRRLLGIREQYIRSALQSGFKVPGVVMRWLFDKNALGLVTELLNKPKEPESSDADNPELDNQDTHPWSFGFDFDQDELLTPAMDSVMVWSPASEGDGATLRNLPVAFGERLATTLSSVIAFLDREQGDSPVNGLAIQRLRPKGGLIDSFELWEWIPKSLMKRKQIPQSVQSFGSPWILGGLPGTCRNAHPSQWDLQGMGQFLHVLAGSCFVVTFPFRDAMERGASWSQASSWLLDLNLPGFTTFAAESFKAASLTKDSSMWIPYGWATLLITKMSSPGPSLVLHIPYLNHGLATQFAWRSQLVAHNQKNLADKCKSAPKLWSLYREELNHWLNTIKPASERSTNSRVNDPMDPELQLALENALVNDGQSQQEATQSTQPQDTQPTGDEAEEAQSKNDKATPIPEAAGAAAAAGEVQALSDEVA
jgi:hypothetical protein